jgi:AcrR family transcriptional regulator
VGVTARRRMTPEDRRRQLLAVGAELFASRSYEAVQMDEVATRAGVSRALLYKHFPNKRDLLAAVYVQATDGLLAASELDPHVPFTDQLLAGLDSHFDYFAANRHAVLAANRTLAGDPTIQAIINDEFAVLRQRMIDVSGLDGHARDVLASVLTGWLVFVRVLVVDWLTNQTFDRAELRDISVGALLGALGDLAPRIEQARQRRLKRQ